jgi:putative spermidine/putrescine transport system substrate-binding protein
MLATNSKHPNCAYMWEKFISTPDAQAQQALSFGETPVNTKACAVMESESPGSCGQYHADASAQYFAKIKFWKTPIATCPDGSQQCVTYDKWVAAWTSITA